MSNIMTSIVVLLNIRFVVVQVGLGCIKVAACSSNYLTKLSISRIQIRGVALLLESAVKLLMLRPSAGLRKGFSAASSRGLAMLSG